MVRTISAAAAPPENRTLALPVRATILCDNDTFLECLDNAKLMAEEAAAFSSISFPASSISVSLNVSVVRIPEDGPEALRGLGSVFGGRAEAKEGEEDEEGWVDEDVADVLVAVGGSGTVQTATLLARGLDKPLLGYVRYGSWRNSYKVGDAVLCTDVYVPMSCRGSSIAIRVIPPDS